MQFVPIKLKALKPKETDFEPRTLGEHIRRRRLILKLIQREVADRLGVNPWTVLNWEKGRTEPPMALVPAIVGFLGYDPFPQPTTLREHLLAKRRAMGWSIKEAARAIGVDPASWGNWERGQTILFRKHRALVARLLGLSTDDVDREMASRWGQSHESL